MKFCSTRGGARGATFEDALFLGYAPDGGLFVPEALPKLPLEELGRWRSLPFTSLAEEVLALFVGDELGPGREGVRRIAQGSYSGFSHKEVVPVRRVDGFFVAELFHGPTFCFKDLGQQPVVRLLAAFAERRRRKVSTLVSTTGDTGPAAMRAVSDVASPWMDIVVFFPHGQISELQRRQMSTVVSDRARLASFEGGGDDMDAPLKRLAADRGFAERHGLCGINSYNIGRPVAQLVFHFWSYFRVLDQLGLDVGAPVDVVLPAGALGNLASGLMAKRMGLPIRRMVAATNINDITHRTFERGEFHRSERMERTISEAINIQVPYNMERIFYYLTEEDSSLVTAWMAEMDRSGRFTLPPEWLAKLRETFSSRRVVDAETCDAIRRGADVHSYLTDPHTAVALAAAWAVYGHGTSDANPATKGASSVPVAVLATASPCKFEASVVAALGAERWAAYAAGPEFPEEAKAVLAAEERSFARLTASGGLNESQAAWEAEVRSWLDAGKGGGSNGAGGSAASAGGAGQQVSRL